MKDTIAILFSLIVGLSLAVYGPFGVVKADGGIFSMELCADGVAKTVYLNSEGNPVDPAQDCPDCLKCCHSVIALATSTPMAGTSDFPSGTHAASPFAQDPVLTSRNIFPAPRGPPAVLHSKRALPQLVATEQPETGHKTRSDGRPLSKDATA